MNKNGTSRCRGSHVSHWEDRRIACARPAWTQAVPRLLVYNGRPLLKRKGRRDRRGDCIVVQGCGEVALVSKAGSHWTRLGPGLASPRRHGPWGITSFSCAKLVVAREVLYDKQLFVKSHTTVSSTERALPSRLEKQTQLSINAREKGGHVWTMSTLTIRHHTRLLAGNYCFRGTLLYRCM